MAIYKSIHTGLEIDEAVSAVSGLTSTVSGHTTQINEIEQDIVYLSGATSGNTQSIINLTQDLSDLNNTVTGHTTQINNINNNIIYLSGVTSGHTTQINEIEQDIIYLSGATYLEFSNVTGSTWVADTTYSGYGYKCNLTAAGVTSTMIGFVNLGHTQAVSGNYSPVCNTGTDIVTIYSKVNTTITVPSIIVFK